MKNRYKIDYNRDWDRVERPFGVYVRAARPLARWKYICAFKSDGEAQSYIVGILELPREIYSSRV
jgi:hypothetical protein